MSEVVQSISIENLANKRQAVAERVMRALDTLKEAESIAKEAGLGFPRIVLDEAYSLRGRGAGITGDFADLAAATAQIVRLIDAPGWQHLLHESGMRSLMDSTARQKWLDQLRDGEVPGLTLDNIRSTFEALHASRGEMFERGVIACFRSLSWSYKTNLPQKFGKRIVVTRLTGGVYVSSGGRVNALDDLVRVFSVLDGKPEPDHRQGMYYQVDNAMKARSWPKTCENDYLSIRLFMNGNGHITFKRLDLVDAMNKILTKHCPDALPPG